MKSNPLFHDSSVSQDSNVQTKFELQSLKTLKGDRVFMRLELDSEVTFYEMGLNEDSGCYEVLVWLKHRKELIYSFLVKRGESWALSTKRYQGQAMHTILEKWKALESTKLKEELESLDQTSKKSQTVELNESHRNSSNEEEFYDNLIKKWDL